MFLAMFLATSRAKFPVTAHPSTKPAKLMCGVLILERLRVPFPIVHQVQLLVLMIREAVVVRVFVLVNRLAERVEMTPLVPQRVPFRMCDATTPRVRAEQVAPAEFRLALTTHKVVPSPVVVPVQPPSVDRVRVPMLSHVNVVNAVSRPVLVSLVVTCQQQSLLGS
jgi:hypothetical protein